MNCLTLIKTGYILSFFQQNGLLRGRLMTFESLPRKLIEPRKHPGQIPRGLGSGLRQPNSVKSPFTISQTALGVIKLPPQHFVNFGFFSSAISLSAHKFQKDVATETVFWRGQSSIFCLKSC